jgi:tetratricopeptide (TPR) repeat protein
MSDLKEETTLDNNETENTSESTEESASPRQIDPSLEGIQLFYEKNKKMVQYVGGGLLVLIAAVVFYKFYYLPEQENEASNEIFWAQAFFDRDSFNLALKGGPMVMSPDGQKPMMGFEQVAENYGITKTGNLANYYAGVCCLRTKQFERGIEFFEKYSGNDAIVGSIAVGAIGDCYMELNKADDAIKYYLKAAEKNSNDFTSPIYLKKAAFAYEMKGSFTDALGTYERIKREYSRSAEGKEIERDIARVKAKGNL